MIEKIIKFGIPVIAAIFYFMTLNYTSKAVDGMGQLSRLVDKLIYWIPILIIFLIVGIVIRYKTGNSFVIHSFLLSLAAMIVVYFVFNTISNMKKANERFYNSSEQIEIRFQNELKKIEELTLQINQNPNDYKLIGERGIAYCNTQQYKKAIPDLVGLIELDQADVEIYTSLISSYEYVGKYEKAIEYIDLINMKSKEGKFKDSDPEFSYFSVSSDLESKLKEKQFIKYTKAIEQNTKDAEIYAKRAELLLENGEYNKGLTDIKKALKIDSGVYWMHVICAKCLTGIEVVKEPDLRKKEKFKEAKYHYELALKLNPSKTFLKEYIEISNKLIDESP